VDLLVESCAAGPTLSTELLELISVLQLEFNVAFKHIFPDMVVHELRSDEFGGH